MSQKPEIIKRATIATSRLFHIEEVYLKFSNGNHRVFERMITNRHGAVLVIPLLDEKTMLLVREYAAGTDRYELGFPKGLIDANETAEQAVDRELQEEIGYGALHIEFLRSMTSAPGYWGGSARVFLAKELYPAKLLGDEPEPLEIVPWPISDYQALLKEETFYEARSIAALFLLRDKLNGC